MGYSTIEGIIRQSTKNKIMDTQLKNYIILKNGNRWILLLDTSTEQSKSFGNLSLTLTD